MPTDLAVRYAVAGAMLVVALAFAWLAVGVGHRLGPRSRAPEANPPYEHGGRTAHKTWGQFRVRYAVLALLFVAFDMEMVYMFP